MAGRTIAAGYYPNQDSTSGCGLTWIASAGTLSMSSFDRTGVPPE